MKRRIITFFILLLTVFSFGCSKKHESTTQAASNQESINYSHQHIDVNNHSTPSETHIPTENIRLMEPFYENRAWILYESDNGTHWAIIDTEGFAIITVDNIREHTFFDNGFAHIVTPENTAYTLDKNGNIISHYAATPSSNENIYVGGGYIIVQKNTSNFDSNSYQYTVYDSHGNVNGIFSTDGSHNAVYLGDGIFNVGEGYYCAKGQIWIEQIPLTNRCNYTAKNGQVLLGSIWDESTKQNGIAILSEDGFLQQKFISELSNNVTVSNFYNNYCIFYDLSNRKICSYNISTNDIYFLDSTYLETIPEYIWRNLPAPPTDGRIIIPAQGADGNNYSYIFDSEFNLITGPMLGSFNSSSEGFICGTVYRASLCSEVYDKNGNYIFSISDMNYSYTDQGTYSCGALLVRSANNEYAFLTPNGTFLFDKINLQSAYTLKLN